jgi:Calcineurin-like phosphoesterase
MFRLWIWPLLVFVAALLPAAAPAKPAPARIVAIGDLHGDYDAWESIVRAAGLVDVKGRWIGGRATLVQLGDVPDRGPDSLKIIRQLMKLQREARGKRGQVIALVGNHEAMNMIGDLRYVHPGEYRAFSNRDSPSRRDRIYEANRAAIETAYKARDPNMTPQAIRDAWMKVNPVGMLEHQIAWGPAGEIGKWIIGNPAVVKLGDNLFVHGGISASYTQFSPEQLNRRVTDALKAQDKAPSSIINDPAGPLWYRGLVTRAPGDEATIAPIAASGQQLTIDQEIALVLEAFHVRRIIVAHTPSTSGIISAYQGALWRIDSGISRAYGGKLTYLEIIGDKVVAHEVPRPAGKPWG